MNKKQGFKRNDVVAYMLSETTSVGTPTILNSQHAESAIIEAVLQNCKEFNRNKRNYPYKPLNAGLNDKRIRELIKNNSWVGEAGHPQNPTLQRQMSIDHSNISHRINSWRWEGDNVVGIVETLNTSRGYDMRNLIRQGVNTAFSLRAVGPVTKTAKGDVVQEPLSILTYDWVFIPSHSGAYQRKVISGVNDSTLTESYCIPILQEQALQYVKDESENFKIITECLEVYGQPIQLSENNNSVIIDMGEDGKLVVGIEKYISQEVNSAFKKLF